MRKSARAFTLFEVLLSLAIMVLIAGMVFGVVNAVVRTTTELSDEQTRRREIDGLRELLSREFHSLDPQTVLTLDVREDQGRYLSEITMEKSPGVFSWGRENWYFGLIVLGLEVGQNGVLRFGIRRQDSDENTRERGGGEARWLPIASDLKSFEWSFYNGTTRMWDGKWDNRAALPVLIRLRYQFVDDQVPDEMVFSLPWTSRLYGQNNPLQ